MKKIAILSLILSCLVVFTFDASSQINWKDKLNKKANKAVDKGLDDVEDELTGKKKKTKYKKDKQTDQQVPVTSEEGAGEEAVSKEEKDALKAYSKYNFIPGDIVIFEDNLAGEENGEFPSKWDLKTGNVEIAQYGEDLVINFPTSTWARIVPLMAETGDYLPEKFTIEFDAYFSEFCTKYLISFWDMVNQEKVEFPDVSITPQDVFVVGYGSANIETPGDAYPFWQRIAISFNIRSLKVYFGEQRTSNIPNIKANPTGITISSSQCHTGKQAMIKNIRIAKGSMKLYDRVITDGKFTTNGIRFDVGKATIRPESMGVINEIYKMMDAHPELKFSVEGHTDSDGDDLSNIELSNERAMAVANKLIAMGIASDRFETKGFGESKPIDTNDTPEGKANNRRVEFIKL